MHGLDASSGDGPESHGRGGRGAAGVEPPGDDGASHVAARHDVSRGGNAKFDPPEVGVFHGELGYEPKLSASGVGDSVWGVWDPEFHFAVDTLARGDVSNPTDGIDVILVHAIARKHWRIDHHGLKFRQVRFPLGRSFNRRLERGRRPHFYRVIHRARD